MRSMLACCVLVAGCSTGAGRFVESGGDDGGLSIDDLSLPAQLSPDLLPPPPDLLQTFHCGNATCAVGNFCCVTGAGMQVQTSCAASCPAGALSVQCDGPQACGGNPCCVPFSTMNGMPVAHDVTCAAGPSDCPPMVNPTTMAGQSRLCSQSSECTDGVPNSQLPDCCTGVINGQQTHFCFNHNFVGFVSGVTCP